MVDSITCTRRIQFCAGHRVMGHENKCAHIHGHNYVVFFEAEAMENLDGIGRVIDFSVLKAELGGWIDKHWDHGFIMHENDDVMHNVLRLFSDVRDSQEGEIGCAFTVDDGGSQWQKVYRLPFNPTAENMAHYLLHKVGPSRLEPYGVRLVSVTVHETENCHAIARL